METFALSRLSESYPNDLTLVATRRDLLIAKISLLQLIPFSAPSTILRADRFRRAGKVTQRSGCTAAELREISRPRSLRRPWRKAPVRRHIEYLRKTCAHSTAIE